MTPTTGYELETEFTLTAPNWNGDGNLHYTYVAESTENGVTTSTILGHGQKKTTLSGIVLNKGDLKLNVIVADAFGAEGKTTTPAVPGGAPGASLTVQAKAVTAAAADSLIAAALGAGKSGKASSAVSKIDTLFKALNAAASAAATADKSIVLTLTASGSVSDYSDTTALRRSIAATAGVDPSSTVITVKAASAIITATITVPASSAASVQALLSSSLGTAAAASTALGITVELDPTVTGGGEGSSSELSISAEKKEEITKAGIGALDQALSSIQP